MVKSSVFVIFSTWIECPEPNKTIIPPDRYHRTYLSFELSINRKKMKVIKLELGQLALKRLGYVNVEAGFPQLDRHKVTRQRYNLNQAYRS